MAAYMMILASAVVAASLAVPGTAQAEPAARLVADTLLDAAALYFVSYDLGPAECA